MASSSTGPGKGRPSLLTKPARAILLRAVGNGTPHKFACAAAGVALRTMQTWTRQGKADEKAGAESIYRTFLRDLKKAEAEGIAIRLAMIMKAGKKDWRAAHAINLSRYPEYFDANRHELRQMRKELAEFKRLLESHSGPASSPDHPPDEGA